MNISLPASSMQSPQNNILTTCKGHLIASGLKLRGMLAALRHQAVHQAGIQNTGILHAKVTRDTNCLSCRSMHATLAPAASEAANYIGERRRTKGRADGNCKSHATLHRGRVIASSVKRHINNFARNDMRFMNRKPMFFSRFT